MCSEKKEHLLEMNPIMADGTIADIISERTPLEFLDWFKKYIQNPANNITCLYLRALASGPLIKCSAFPSYIVNGLRFNSSAGDTSKATSNSGVWVNGADLGGEAHDFYGKLRRIIRFEYPGIPLKRTVLFEVHWYDPTLEGTRMNDEYEMVDINHKKKYR